jgi:hypothetical protein
MHKSFKIVAAWFMCACCLTSCGDGGGDGAATAADLETLRARLSDRLFEFGRASGNSDRNAFLTGIHQLQLCRAGIFAWKETTSFSSSVGGMTSEDMHTGTWTLRTDGGAVIVDLAIEHSSAKSPPANPWFRVTVEGGVVSFDGATASDGDVAADCAEGARERR